MAEAPRGRGTVALEELLVRHGAITQAQVDQAREEVKRWGGDLGRAFVDLGFISEELLMRAYAHALGIPFVDPSRQPLAPKQVMVLGVRLCERFGVIAVAADRQKRTARIATSEPTNTKLHHELAAATGFRLDLACATADAIARGIRIYFYGETTPPAREQEKPERAPAHTPITPVSKLSERVHKLEVYVAGLKAEIAADLTANPQLAGLAARLEFLEQVASIDVGQLRALTEVLIESRVIKPEALAAKLKARKP